MKLEIFSVFDKKSRIYQPPYYCHNIPHALRMFTTIFNENGAVTSTYPDDFSVWKLGTFDDDSGAIVPEEKPIHVCEAVDLVAKNEKPKFTQMETEHAGAE